MIGAPVRRSAAVPGRTTVGRLGTDLRVPASSAGPLRAGHRPRHGFIGALSKRAARLHVGRRRAAPAVGHGPAAPPAIPRRAIAPPCCSRSRTTAPTPAPASAAGRRTGLDTAGPRRAVIACVGGRARSRALDTGQAPAEDRDALRRHPREPAPPRRRPGGTLCHGRGPLRLTALSLRPLSRRNHDNPQRRPGADSRRMTQAGLTRARRTADRSRADRRSE